MGLNLKVDITAIEQLKRLGLDPEQVKRCISTHLDPDRVGGIGDFNNMEIHVSREEHETYSCARNQRHLSLQLSICENG